MSICVKRCPLPRSIAVASEHISAGFGVTALRLQRKTDESVAKDTLNTIQRPNQIKRKRNNSNVSLWWPYATIIQL